MYFITHMPYSFGHTIIWVICDCLTKFMHFIALPTKFSHKNLATHFLIEICRLHKIPKSIVSDCDPYLFITFYKEYFKFQGTRLKHNTFYQPETDGQSKMVNCCLET